jgi:hypothetical protein
MKRNEPLPSLVAADVAEILRSIPSRPAYSDWVKVIFAVAGILPPDEAAAQLAEWSPEEKPREYATKIKSAPERTPGALINIAKAHGFDASAFARRRAAGCAIRPVAPKQATHIATPITLSPARRLPKDTARLGKAVELETLATLRGLASAAGLEAMQVAGCLAFADDLNDTDAEGNWRPVKSWLVLDPTRRNVSARRLDGQPWNCCHGHKSRCLSGTGSKSWPVGITLAAPGQRLDIAEGEGDFLALWHLHALAGAKDAAPVGLLGSCATFDAFASEIAPFIAGRTVLIFAHIDATGTGQAAAQKWADAFYRLGAESVRVRNLSAWLDAGGNDLNDAIAADATRQHAIAADLCPACSARNVITPFGGPTCTCVPCAWPAFTPDRITSDTVCV